MESKVIKCPKCSTKFEVNIIDDTDIIKPVVYLDDGHGVDTPGKRTPEFYNGQYIKENYFNSRVIFELEKIILEEGLMIPVLTAPEEEDISLSVRCQRANSDFEARNININMSVFYSQHYNCQDAEWGGTKGGIETFHYPNSENGKKLATFIYNESIKGTPQEHRGVKAGNFYVLRETIMPSCLNESGFMDVKKEALLMANPNFIKETANEVNVALKKYFNLI